MCIRDRGYPLSTYIPGGRNAGRVEQVHGGVSRNVAEDIANAVSYTHLDVYKRQALSCTRRDWQSRVFSVSTTSSTSLPEFAPAS